MILYTLVSGPYERLLKECFLPSVRRWGEYDLHIEHVPPPVPGTGRGSDGLRAVHAHKAALMVRAIEENWGRCFVFSDVDVAFLQPTREWLLARIEGYDVCAQQGDQPNVANTGFMVIRANEVMLRLWKRLQRRLVSRPDMRTDPLFNDLLAPGMLPLWLLGRPLQRINRALAASGLVGAVRHHHLPRSVYHIGMAPGYQRSWLNHLPGEDALEYPAGVRLVHAAYVAGIDDKLVLLHRACNRSSDKPGTGSSAGTEAGLAR